MTGGWIEVVPCQEPSGNRKNHAASSVGHRHPYHPDGSTRTRPAAYQEKRSSDAPEAREGDLRRIPAFQLASCGSDQSRRRARWLRPRLVRVGVCL